jgi:hypothetical protein
MRVSAKNDDGDPLLPISNERACGRTNHTMAAPKPGHTEGANTAESTISNTRISEAPSSSTEPPTEPALKEPPPESPANIRRRSHVILSFWSIVVLLGLPIWWMTTTIYRAPLPLTGMAQWADGKVSSSYGLSSWKQFLFAPFSRFDILTYSSVTRHADQSFP